MLFHLDVHLQTVLPPGEELLNHTPTRRSYTSSCCVQIVSLHYETCIVIWSVNKYVVLKAQESR